MCSTTAKSLLQVVKLEQVVMPKRTTWRSQKTLNQPPSPDCIYLLQYIYMCVHQYNSACLLYVTTIFFILIVILIHQNITSEMLVYCIQPRSVVCISSGLQRCDVLTFHSVCISHSVKREDLRSSEIIPEYDRACFFKVKYTL